MTENKEHYNPETGSITAVEAPAQASTEPVVETGFTPPTPAGSYSPSPTHLTSEEPSEHPKVSTILTLTLLSFLLPILAFFSWAMAVGAQKEEKTQGLKPSPIIQSSKIVSIVMSVYCILLALFLVGYFALIVAIVQGSSGTGI